VEKNIFKIFVSASEIQEAGLRDTHCTNCERSSLGSTPVYRRFIKVIQKNTRPERGATECTISWARTIAVQPGVVIVAFCFSEPMCRKRSLYRGLSAWWHLRHIAGQCSIVKLINRDASAMYRQKTRDANEEFWSRCQA
jgi:hypothetical protein